MVLSFSMKRIFFCLFLTSLMVPPMVKGQLAAQDIPVTGSVRDAVTKTPIPNAVIRIRELSKGTICNADGVYRLNLPPGSYSIIASCLGYGADTVSLTLMMPVQQDFLLNESEIFLPEIVVTGEDPAYEIIRQAIAHKNRWKSRLHSYQLDAFTRQVLKRDTTIASITEAFTKGYWREGDTLHEVSVNRRQTENIPEGRNFASVGRLLNFYEDNIRFLGYTFAGPIATDAFDHYHFKLLRTRQAGKSDLYEIALIPLSESAPRFRGQVSIAGGTYALVGVDVEPNEAFLLPFVKEKRLRYRQQFALFDQTYWLPADIRIDGEFKAGIAGFSLPVIGFSQTSVITRYDINVPLPDSIFQKPRFARDTLTSTADTSGWRGGDVLPLTHAEQHAYESIDSTKTLEVQFRPRGFAMTLGDDSSAFGTVSDFLDLSFNRVEGVHLGAKILLEKVIDWLSLYGGVAYGFSDRETKYRIGAQFHVRDKGNLSLGFEYHRHLDAIPDQGYYGEIYNSVTAALVKNDYRDYYLSEGAEISASIEPSRVFRMAVSFLSENHTSATRNTDFSVLGGPPYRENPAVNDGRYEAVRVQARIGRKPVPLDMFGTDALDVLLEGPLGTRGGLQVTGVGTVHITTLSTRFLSPPGFRIRLAAGLSDGVDRQRLPSIESASSGIAPFGVMKAMNVKEFHGEDYVTMNVEHNFRSLPFLLLDAPFLYENNIEFVVHAGFARNWEASNNKVMTAVPGPNEPAPLQTTDGWYSEAGFGISRIFELLRCDFTWRFSEPRFFRFTLGAANIL